MWSHPNWPSTRIPTRLGHVTLLADEMEMKNDRNFKSQLMGPDDLFFLCNETFFSNQKFSVDLGPRVEMGSTVLSFWGGRVEWVRKKPLLLQTEEEGGMFVTTAVSRI